MTQAGEVKNIFWYHCAQLMHFRDSNNSENRKMFLAQKLIYDD